MSSRFQAAWQKLRPQPRFRDPVVDFQISATSPQALAAEPLHRSRRGPFTSQHGNYVSLHLGGSTTDGVHAIMDRTAPDQLVFSYTQIMAGFTRFVHAPAAVGMLGLGGGSLAKHCYKCLPQARIVVAEISPEVIALRHQFFIPNDDARFSVLETDGAAFVERSRTTFDVLLIDAYDEDGYPSHLGTSRFYHHCRRALVPQGVLVLNYSGAAWKLGSRRLSRVFRRQTVFYHCPDGDNVVAFATNGPLPAVVR